MRGRYPISGGEMAWSSRTGRVTGRVVIPAVSTVRGGGRAAVCHRAKIALLRTRGIRATVFGLAMVHGAN